MDNQESNRHPFEDFPREVLYNRISRRQFFEVMEAETRLFAREERGGKIPQLGIMEDHELYDIIPRILPDTRIIPDENVIWAIPKGSSRRIHLLDIEPKTLNVFNNINGRNTLKEIAQFLSSFSGMPFDRSFLFTRGLFLTLVKAQVCLPINNPTLG
jgi:hypothetical protein